MNEKTLFSDVRAIIFELDGTLLPLDRLRFDAYRRALAKWKQPFEWETFRRLVGRTKRETCQRIIKQTGLLIQTNLLASAADAEMIAVMSQPKMPVLASALPFLRAIPRNKYTTVLASTRPMDQIESLLKRTGLGQFFEQVVSGSELTKKPPEPDLYTLASELVGMNPWNTVVLESSAIGVLAAVRAGARVVAVPTDSTRKEDLSRAHIRVEKLEQLIPYL